MREIMTGRELARAIKQVGAELDKLPEAVLKLPIVVLDYDIAPGRVWTARMGFDGALRTRWIPCEIGRGATHLVVVMYCGN
jgi:hypothetical protein